MIDVQVVDGQGRGHALKVNGEGELTATIHSHPPRDETDAQFPYSDFFKTTSGSSDMVVDGSTTPVEFAIHALVGYDLYITSFSILIADAGAALNEFGALPALTNGCDIKWQTREFGTKNILTEIKQNLDFYRLTSQTPAIVDLSGGGADAVNVFVDLNVAFGLSYGLRLRKDSTDKITFTINDNLAGITTMNVIAKGFEF